MPDAVSRVESFDLSLFERIPSQTSPEDKRALLCVQKAIAKNHKSFAYYEIGSHLGGSIQPYLVDPRCTKIYSIDPRPFVGPDDRSEGWLAVYEGNSTQPHAGLAR